MPEYEKVDKVGDWGIYRARHTQTYAEWQAEERHRRLVTWLRWSATIGVIIFIIVAALIEGWL